MLKRALRLLALGPLAAAALIPFAPARADLVGGVPQVGRIAIGTCPVEAAAVDPGLGVLVLVRAVASTCSSATTLSYTMEAYSTRTLAKLAGATLDTAQNAGVYVHNMPLDPVHHMVFVLWYNGLYPSAGAGEEYSLTQLLAGPKDFKPAASFAIPATAVTLASGPDGTGANPASDPAAASGDTALEPTGAYFDPAASRLYLILTEGESYGTLPGSPTASHGPLAQDSYVLALDGGGNQVWATRLTLCTGPAQGTGFYDSPVLLVRSSGAARLAASCLASRVLVGTSGGQGAGTMLTYDIPLDAQGLPNSAAVTYVLGRVNSEGAVSDPASGRIFLANPPSIAATAAGASASGPSAVVYDVANRAYVGAPSLGGAGESTVPFGYVMAAAGGRLYGVGVSGVTVVDGEATPPGQGLVSPTYGCQVIFGVADPLTRRVFVRPLQGCTSSNSYQAGAADHLDVLQDDYQSVSPPPFPAPDTLTLQQDEQPGVTEAQYNGSAQATGARVRLVGGESGLVDGLTLGEYSFELGQTGTSDPVGDYGARELNMAVVPSVELGNFQAQAETVAATVDDTTASDLQAKTNQPWPFGTVSCSDPGTASDQATYPGDTSSQAGCKLGSNAAASSQAESLGIVLAATGQSGPAVVDLGKAFASSSVTVGPNGLVSDAKSVVTGIDLGAVRIDNVSTDATCRAHGRTGTAGCTFTRLLDGVTIEGGRSESCTQVAGPGGEVDTCQALLAQLNSIEPGYLTFSTPLPDARPDYANGSPGGYQALAQRELYEHLQDSAVNYDESIEVPGLRMLYVQDSNSNPSRLDLQLGNVEAESHYGITALPAACASCGDVLGVSDTVPPQAPLAGPPAPGPRLVAVNADVTRTVLSRIWSGLKFLVRSPAAAAAATALFLMLASPLLMGMRRRRLDLMVGGLLEP